MTHSIAITRYDADDPRLGRQVEHDSRSLAYAVRAAAPKTLVDVFHADAAPILNQGNLGACVGFTGADILNTAWALRLRAKVMAGRYFTNKDGIRFYKQATVCDNIQGAYPPTDTGSSGLGLAKALKKFGLIAGYEHAFTWDHVTAAIATQPVCIGALWTKPMFTPDKQGVIHAGPINDSTIAGGHEWMLRGISYTKGLALGRNHWAKTWNPGTSGEKLPGEFWIPITDLQALLARQGDVTVLKLAP